VAGNKRRVFSNNSIGKIKKIGLETGIFENTLNREEEIEDTILHIGNPGFNNEIISEVIKNNKIKNCKNMIIDFENGENINLKCGLVSNNFSDSKNEGKWYNLNDISKRIPKSCRLMIINDTEIPTGHYGIIEYKKLILESERIMVCNIHKPKQHRIALRVAQEVRGLIRIENIINVKGKNMAYAWIEPGPNVNTPKPLKYPDVTGILPKKLIIPDPQGIANDYINIIKIVDAKKDWSPKINISIVIPVYNRNEVLGKTLAMICHQTYPLDLLEIVIADDGSSDNTLKIVDKFRDRLEINYIHQKDDGFRAAAVRNLGIRLAKYENIILLDGDVAPIPSLVEVYAKHLEVSKKSLFCGHRRYIDANKLTIEKCEESPEHMLSLNDIVSKNKIFKKDGHVLDWRMGMYRQTDNLRFEKYPFRAVCSGNLAFHISVYERAGGFDEEFRAWGKEDTEWGFRVWNKGDYIIPLYEACGLHQEPEGGRNETDREMGLNEVMPIFIDRVPVMYRKEEHGKEHSVPLVSIYIPAYNAESSIVETIESVLNQTFEDLEICIGIDGPKDGTLKKIEDNYLHNPRVRWVHQENEGIGSASNSAIQLCRGVFIGQLDSDDLLLPDAIEILVEEIQRDTRLGVVYGSFQKETPEGEFLEDGYDWPDYSREKLMFGCIVHHFRLFRSRDWWRTVGFATDITNAVDYDMFLKLSNVTEMKHVQEWTYVYRIHDKSTSINQREMQIKNHYVVLNRHLKRIDLGSKWECLQVEDKERKVKYQLKATVHEPEYASLPFSKAQMKMKEATPLIIQRLAKLESLKKPWTIYHKPEERFYERILALVKNKRYVIENKEIRNLIKIYGHNQRKIMDKIHLIHTNEGE